VDLKESGGQPRSENRVKHILDSSFRYKPSFDTDVRKTFERVRKQQQDKAREQSKANPEVRVKVLQLEQVKKASSS
jgi:hypothetical protein